MFSSILLETDVMGWSVFSRNVRMSVCPGIHGLVGRMRGSFYVNVMDHRERGYRVGYLLWQSQVT